MYNHCKNAAEQVLREEVILPVDTEGCRCGAAAEETSENAEVSASVEFEPEPADVSRVFCPLTCARRIYHALIDSAAGEQAARRTAMHSATENANEMVETLSRVYNRVRQGAITTEISRSLVALQLWRIKWLTENAYQSGTRSHAKGATGRIVRIVGPVVDVEFPADQLPAIYNALTVDAKPPPAK